MKENITTNGKANFYLGIALTLFVLPFAYFKHAYIYTNFTFWLGIIFAPFIFRQIGTSSSRRYFFPAISLAILLLFIRSSSAYYFFFAFAILFLIENIKGKLNYLPIFLFIVVAPIIQNFSNIWSFPIRLKLSELAGKAMNFLGYSVEVVGNIIYLDNMPFSVDPECMGLKMLSTSMILVLLVLAYFERKHQQNFNFFDIGISFCVTIALTVLANFIRLLVLVLFKILPENPLHELLGLISLIVYVLLPIYFFIKIISYWKWKNHLIAESSKIDISFYCLNIKNIVLIGILFFFLLINGPQFLKNKPSNQAFFEKINLPNFEKSVTEKGILKLENEQALIYIKPPIRPFQGSHDPRICWQGSGYKFVNIQPKLIDSVEIYTALLVENQDTLHTAWWYSNGEIKTNSELKWRWESLKNNGEFYLVNANGESQKDVELVIKELLLSKF